MIANAQQAVQEPPPRVPPVAAAAPSSVSSAGSEADGGLGALMIHALARQHGCMLTSLWQLILPVMSNCKARSTQSLSVPAS